MIPPHDDAFVARRPSRGVTTLLAGLIALLLVLVAGVALWSNYQARGGSERLRETAAIQAQALAFLSRLQDAETEQRGYLLTGVASFLAPYEEAASKLPDDIDALLVLVDRIPSQKNRAIAMQGLLEVRLNELGRSVELVRQDRREEAISLIASRGGRSAMDEIRDLVAAMLDDGGQSLMARETELEHWNHLSTGAIAMGAAVALLLTAVTLHMIRRQFSMANAFNSSLSRLNAGLEGEVVKRNREAESARAAAIAEKERAEAERGRVELLLQDVNHRVGNNLAMVSGMLGLQISSTSNEEVRTSLTAAQGRIATIANAQRRLRLSNDLSTVQADELIESSISDLRAASGDAERIDIVTRLAPLKAQSRDAVTLAILANEIVTNALKHAFVGRPGGRILVELDVPEARPPVLVVEDDGCGMAGTIPQRPGSLGHKLIERFARQFGGGLSVSTPPGGGTRIAVSLPDLAMRPMEGLHPAE